MEPGINKFPSPGRQWIRLVFLIGCAATAVMAECSREKGQFRCGTTSQCIEQRHQCDGKADCQDESDEEGCENSKDDITNSLFYKRPEADREWESLDCNLVLDQATEVCQCREGTRLYCEQKKWEAVPKLPHNVTELDISTNFFPVLKTGALANLTHLYKLIMTGGRLLHIERGAFIGSLNLMIMHLQNNRLQYLLNGTFRGPLAIQEINLSLNKFETLAANFFDGLHSLIRLRLEGNRIAEIEDGAFEGLERLTFLNLASNRLTRVKAGAFDGLSRLTTLLLSDNHISTIKEGGFSGLNQIQTLSLDDNDLRSISKSDFAGLRTLMNLHLSGNQIGHMDEVSFSGCSSLDSLFLKKNRLNFVQANTFAGINLSHIQFDHFYMCSYALHVRVCEPRGDGISSHFNLLSNKLLRVSVWLVALTSITVNILVLFGRYFVFEDDRVHSFFIRNLALADLLMGVYLLTIGIHDVHFRGVYIKRQFEWRFSWTCTFCGMLSTISALVSVLVICVVTLIRLISVAHPFGILKAMVGRPRLAYACMLTIWVIAGMMATLPVLPLKYFKTKFYSSNGVCLPLQIHDAFGPAWEYSLLIYLVINLVAAIIVAFAYIRMFVLIKSSQVTLRTNRQVLESSLALRFFCIVLTDFLCWMPIIVCKISALMGHPPSGDLYGWIAVFILPINSALNPVLYTLTTRVFKERLAQFHHFCVRNSLRKTETLDSALTALRKFSHRQP